jgi:hypothetical protein
MVGARTAFVDGSGVSQVKGLNDRKACLNQPAPDTIG